LENCENCHGIGKAESPCFMDYEAWTQRITKGESALIDSAINGFEGKSEAGMPPRGGNDELTDEQVAAATKYMIHFSTKP
ncbi:MAG: c-type cytochrome, partial [Limisphaerales bacterium]